MTTRTPLAVDEWYHCYNRGVDKRKIFNTARDYDRFLSLLFLCNATERLHVSDFKKASLEQLLSSDLERGSQLVDIGAWCLMPNHVHLVLKERQEGGIARFMQKVVTGYTMYFNKKNERTGPLLSGRFKSKHIPDDRYFKQLLAYVHMNPIELSLPEWQFGKVSVTSASKVLDRYQYSSLHAFENRRNKQRVILGDAVFKVFDVMPTRKRMLTDAYEYLRENTNVKVEP